jgi:hypothetical protein
MIERLDHVDDLRVKLPSTLLQQSAVRDLVRESMLEGVLEIRIEARLVKELGGLEVIEPTAERLVRHLGDRLEQRERNVPADDRGDLEKMLVLRGEPVDARRQHRLDRGGNPDRLHRLRQSIPAWLSRQLLRLHQRANRFLQEKRVPALDEELLERGEPGIVAEECLQQLPGALGWERIEPHLAVGRLAAPGMLVLGPVVHQQQQAR